MRHSAIYNIASGCHQTRTRQRGVYTLLISMVLIAASMLAIQGLTRSSAMEMRIARNDKQAVEASHAAESGLDYGIAWYGNQEPSWTVAGGIATGSPDTAPPTVAAANGDNYSISVTYTRNSPDFILVSSTAVAASDPDVTASVQQYVHSNILINDPDFADAPLTLDGCSTDNTGAPDLFPGAGNISIQTSSTTDCIDEGHIDYNGGTEVLSAFTGDIWDYFFKVSREDMKGVADAEVAAGTPDDERTVVWVTSTSNYTTSWGAADNPVILVFAPSADCPKITGDPTIYGIVFVDSACDSSNGWGGAEIFGSAAINGDMNKLTANTEITHFSSVADGDSTNLKLGWVARIPGSWRDF